MRLTWLSFVVFAAGVAAQAPSRGFRLHALFADHMVLPQQTSVPVTGVAPAGAEVSVTGSWNGETARARAGADGRFAVALATPRAGGPFALDVRCGGDRRAIADVLVGDVWLGSGQSNMEMPVGPENGWRGGVRDWQRECAAADLPRLRVFDVARRTAASPVDDVKGEWRVATPAVAASFSATAFFFGRELVQRRGEPLGLVTSSWGGTVCEAWTSAAGLADFPVFQPEIKAMAAWDDPTELSTRRRQWWQQVAALDPVVDGRRPEDPAFDDGTWSPVDLPHTWSQAGLADHDGVAWYRRAVDVPADWRGADLLLQLGPIDDMDTVWFDGVRVGGDENGGRWDRPRDYRVPGSIVRGGRSVLAVRVVDTGGEGGIRGDAEAMRLSPATGGGGGLELHSAWRVVRGAELSRLPPWPATGSRQNTATALWNGMIAPLVPFPFRGVIWYQGESNRERPEQYARLFPAMIVDWRRAFGRELPFLFTQIAPFAYRGDTGEAFRLRLAQTAALALADTGMAATTDVGEAEDIHPIDKQAVGHRLALQALAKVYGDERVVCDGPRPVFAYAVDDCFCIEFDQRGADLRTGPQGPHHFEVAGDDGVFRAAVATLTEDGVALRSNCVKHPVVARYCHAAAASGDLWNGHGLPAAPFEVRAR